MKANELMVGDLVLVTPIGKIAKVFEISSIDNEIGVFFTPADGDAFDLTEIEPIPLTEEMLLANGFTKFVDGYRRTFYNYVVDNNLMLDISDWEDEGLKVAVGGKFRGLKYVHELQHILRLIGMTEVADNFKIK